MNGPDCGQYAPVTGWWLPVCRRQAGHDGEHTGVDRFGFLRVWGRVAASERSLGYSFFEGTAQVDQVWDVPE